MSDVETALKHSLTVRMRLSHFDPQGPLDNIPTTEVCSAHALQVKNTSGSLPLSVDSLSHLCCSSCSESPLQLARSGAAQGQTLLKNTDMALPLLKSAKIAVRRKLKDLSRCA